MANDFAKVYAGLFEGSLRDSPPYAKLLLIAMILRANKDGIVLGAPSFWAAYIPLPIEDVKKCFDVLTSPDPESTTPDEDGRRVVPHGDGKNLWRIVNYKKYYDSPAVIAERSRKREWDRANKETRHKSADKRNQEQAKPDKPDEPDTRVEESRREKNSPKSPPGTSGGPSTSLGQSRADRTQSGRVVGPAPAEVINTEAQAKLDLLRKQAQASKNGSPEPNINDFLQEIEQEVQSTVRLPYKDN